MGAFERRSLGILVGLLSLTCTFGCRSAFHSDPDTAEGSSTNAATQGTSTTDDESGSGSDTAAETSTGGSESTGDEETSGTETGCETGTETGVDETGADETTDSGGDEGPMCQPKGGQCDFDVDCCDSPCFGGKCGCAGPGQACGGQNVNCCASTCISGCCGGC